MAEVMVDIVCRDIFVSRVQFFGRLKTNRTALYESLIGWSSLRFEKECLCQQRSIQSRFSVRNGQGILGGKKLFTSHVKVLVLL